MYSKEEGGGLEWIVLYWIGKILPNTPDLSIDSRPLCFV